MMTTVAMTIATTTAVAISIACACAISTTSAVGISIAMSAIAIHAAMLSIGASTVSTIAENGAIFMIAILALLRHTVLIGDSIGVA